MKVREVKVRTEYTIEYSLNDLWDIVAKAKADFTNIDECFYNYDGENTKLGQVISLFKSFNDLDGHDCSYLARKFGYDGCINCGYYDDRKDVRIMTVYNNGDTL